MIIKINPLLAALVGYLLESDKYTIECASSIHIIVSTRLKTSGSMAQSTVIKRYIADVFMSEDSFDVYYGYGREVIISIADPESMAKVGGIINAA